LRDITPELTADKAAWKNSFAAQAALDLYKFNDKYYGVPITWGAVGFWYNKALFEKAGIKELPKTWDELLDAVKKLKTAGITPIALGEKDKWPGHFWWVYLAVRLGGQKAFDAAYNRTGSFTDEPFVKAGQMLKELVDMEPFPEGFLSLTYPQQGAIMGNGEAGMELMGQWSPGVQAGNATNGKGIPDKLGWFPFPMVEGGAGDPSDTMGGGDGIALGKNAPDEAVDFVKYLTTTEVQKGFIDLNMGWVPTIKEAEQYLDDPLLQEVMAARNNAKYFQLYTTTSFYRLLWLPQSLMVRMAFLRRHYHQKT
jgi:raffinose/stachyose/melibiose transport system substrate-binding protein